MSYQVLARKLRPADFSSLVGQDHVVRALVHALDNERLHHAYLFTGTRGVGKTTIARILAKCLNCEEGVSSQPCGVCGTCREIAEGRFVDLIEVDAASRTKVDDTRELLDNVQYLPSHGRFKVYLIDEVHRLSQSSFNALLKTLEEPPEHVKFLLATTDPKKVPVTVLSRCLQFQLKNLLPTRIESYLAEVLAAESIDFEEEALALIARSATGSMRDALSITDQAIAFGGGELAAADVADMLGTIGRGEVAALLDALAGGDGAELLAICGQLAEQATDFNLVLESMLAVLHDVAVAQTVGPGDTEDPGLIDRLCQALAPETVQLFYQIALMGLRDLSLAPDLRVGFEMTMLRMLAFEPVAGPAGAPDGPPSRSKPTSEPRSQAVDSNPGTRDQQKAAAPTAQAAPGGVSPVSNVTPIKPADAGDPGPSGDAGQPVDGIDMASWYTLVAGLSVAGVARMLLEHSVPLRLDEGCWTLCLDQAHDMLLNDKQTRTVERLLAEHRGAPIALSIEVGEPWSETPAARNVRRERERHQQALEALSTDEQVRSLVEEFGAELKPESVKPLVTGETMATDETASKERQGEVTRGEA
jgi:DNA polymerase-3 subunit gamma/tau